MGHILKLVMDSIVDGTSLGCGRAMGSFGLPHTATGALPRAEEVVFYRTYAFLRSGTVSIAVLRATSRS